MLTIIAVAAFGLGAILLSLYRLLSDPLQDIPGPFLARFTRLWEVFEVRKRNFEEVNAELHQKYGPIVRLAPGRYSINDPTAVRTIYGHESRLEKSDYYRAFGHPDEKESTVFNTIHNAPHAERRRKVAGLYSLTTVLSYEKFVDNQNEILCNHLRSFAASGASFDVLRWMQFYAFDVIGEITVGEPFGMMPAGRDKDGFLEGLDFANVYSQQIGLMSEWHARIEKVASFFRLATPTQPILDFMHKQIALRKTRKPTSGRADFLEKMFHMIEDGKVSDRDLRATMLVNVAAGSDTTGISLSSIIYYLYQNPRCLQRLREEIDSSNASEPVKYEEAKTMPYLQAVIKESIRLHPAVGQVLPRVIGPEGAELAGRYFPPGSVVGMNPWVLHLNKDAFGPDAHEFRPERWLGPHDEVTHLEHSLLSFGAGTRVCLGKNISMLEMTKVIPQIYRSFDFVMDESIPSTMENTFFVKKHFSMKVVERAKAASTSYTLD